MTCTYKRSTTESPEVRCARLHIAPVGDPNLPGLESAEELFLLVPPYTARATVRVGGRIDRAAVSNGDEFVVEAGARRATPS